MNSRKIRRQTVWVVAGGLLLVTACGVLAGISGEFRYGGDKLERPVVALTALLMFAGLVYLVTMLHLLKLPKSGKTLALVIGVGLVSRAIVLNSSPILEDDYYRYLWDGALTANGHNPYSYVPSDAIGPPYESGVPTEIRELAEESGTAIMRVNHRDLGTVYPPVAQAVFAVAHFLKPWSLSALRFTLLCFDLSTLGLVIVLLRLLGKPAQQAAIYWWNPLVIKEVVNSAHMDVIALPLALAALLFALRHAPSRSALMLVAAVGTKVWPVMLAPVLFRAIRASRARLAAAGTMSVLFLLLLVLPLLPVLEAGRNSGFAEYGKRWEMNDALFMAVHRTTGVIAHMVGAESGGSGVDLAARILVFAMLVGWTARLSYRELRGPDDVCNRIVLVLGALFMLSPTQYPWYYVWLVPFLALNPRPSLLVLTAMLPMYYLLFHFDARGTSSIFHNALVWVEYAPVFLLLIWEWRHARLKPITTEGIAGTDKV